MLSATTLSVYAERQQALTPRACPHHKAGSDSGGGPAPTLPSAVHPKSQSVPFDTCDAEGSAHQHRAWVAAAKSRWVQPFLACTGRLTAAWKGVMRWPWRHALRSGSACRRLPCWQGPTYLVDALAGRVAVSHSWEACGGHLRVEPADYFNLSWTKRDDCLSRRQCRAACERMLGLLPTRMAPHSTG